VFLLLDIKSYDDALVVIPGAFMSVNGRPKACIAKFDRGTRFFGEEFTVHSDADVIWGVPAVWEN
jgi:hypothetical protein